MHTLSKRVRRQEKKLKEKNRQQGKNEVFISPGYLFRYNGLEMSQSQSRRQNWILWCLRVHSQIHVKIVRLKM